MSPLKIMILMECYCCPRPGANVLPAIWNSPAARQARSEFVSRGLVSPDDFSVTLEGEALVERLKSVSP